MKHLSEILFVIFFAIAFQGKAQDMGKDTAAFNDSERVLKKEMSRVSRIDTVENSPKLITIMGYDSNNRVVRKESQFYSKETDLKWKQVELFDKSGNLILEINDGLVPCKHLFEYDKQNRLVKERFLFAGFEEKRVDYKYNDKGNLIEKVEN